jgi:hypothetical protein
MNGVVTVFNVRRSDLAAPTTSCVRGRHPPCKRPAQSRDRPRGDGRLLPSPQGFGSDTILVIGEGERGIAYHSSLVYRLAYASLSKPGPCRCWPLMPSEIIISAGGLPSQGVTNNWRRTGPNIHMSLRSPSQLKAPRALCFRLTSRCSSEDHVIVSHLRRGVFRTWFWVDDGYQASGRPSKAAHVSRRFASLPGMLIN